MMPLGSTVSAERISAAPRLRASRIGDVLLTLLWAGFATSALFSTVQSAAAGDWLAAGHKGMVAIVSIINGVLFLLRGPALARDGRFVPVMTALLGMAMVYPLSALPLTWRPDWLLAGTTVALIALYGFVAWALLTLRSSFSIVPEARSLVQSGPYGLVRHPLYAAYIAGYVVIMLPRIGFSAIVLAGIGILCEVLRARYEERILASEFPEYADYQRAVPAFLPGMQAFRRAESSLGALPAAMPARSEARPAGPIAGRAVASVKGGGR